MLVTEWPQLADVDWASLAATMRSAVFVDGRNMLDPEAMREAGYRYAAIGRAPPTGLDPMEAIVLAGGRRSASATPPAGRPKSLVPVGGRPLLAWQIGRLRQRGVERVIVSCLGGQEEEFRARPRGLGVELACAGEPERLGRGGGIRYAAASGARPATCSR